MEKQLTPENILQTGMASLASENFTLCCRDRGFHRTGARRGKP